MACKSLGDLAGLAGASGLECCPLLQSHQSAQLKWACCVWVRWCIGLRERLCSGPPRRFVLAYERPQGELNSVSKSRQSSHCSGRAANRSLASRCPAQWHCCAKGPARLPPSALAPCLPLSTRRHLARLAEMAAIFRAAKAAVSNPVRFDKRRHVD